MQLGIGLNLANPQKPGGFSPSDVSGLVLWLDPSTGMSEPDWSDQSGSGNDFTTAAGTPTFTPGTGIAFDGVDDRMECATFEASAIFIVCTVTTVCPLLGGVLGDRSVDVGIRRGVDGDANWRGLTTGNSGDWSFSGDFRINGVQSETVAAGVKHLVTAINVDSYIPVGNWGLGNYYSGNDRPFKGTVNEVLVYLGDISASRTAIEAYLMGRHGL
jgi:hypothetical protein